MFLPGYEPPTASREEDLPGYVHRLRLPSFSRIFFFCLFMALICPTEGCLPSWFRHEKKHPPEALEGKFPTEAPETFSKNGIRVEQSKDSKYVPPDEEYEVEYVEEEEPPSAGNYGTPSPIVADPQLEEYRRAYMERECEGWCYSGGNCSVHVHPETYAYIGKECRCPYNYMGARCEEHYVRTLWAPIKGDPTVHRVEIVSKNGQDTSSLAARGLARIHLNLSMSSVPVLSVFFIMVIVAVGIAVFSYRRITKRHETARFTSWRSSPSLSTDSTPTDAHLARAGGKYKNKAPFSTRMPPRSETFRGTVPLLLEGGHFVLPKTAIGQTVADEKRKSSHGSSCPREPPPVTLPRKNTLPTTG